MTEQELRRTAIVIQPRGRAVLCVWAAVPGLLLAPFVFWQSIWAGGVFCAVWAALAAGCALAAANELHQTLSEGRSCQFTDMLIDASGAALDNDRMLLT